MIPIEIFFPQEIPVQKYPCFLPFISYWEFLFETMPNGETSFYSHLTAKVWDFKKCKENFKYLAMNFWSNALPRSAPGLKFQTPRFIFEVSSWKDRGKLSLSNDTIHDNVCFIITCSNFTYKLFTAFYACKKLFKLIFINFEVE